MQEIDLVEYLGLEAEIVDAGKTVVVGDLADAIEVDEIGGQNVEGIDTGFELDPQWNDEPENETGGEQSPAGKIGFAKSWGWAKQTTGPHSIDKGAPMRFREPGSGVHRVAFPEEMAAIRDRD